MSRSWWTVTPVHGRAAEVEDVLAATAELAAMAWADGRLTDEEPLVDVSAPGEPTQRFALRARVCWCAKVVAS